MGPGNWEEDIPTDSQVLGFAHNADVTSAGGIGPSNTVGNSSLRDGGSATGGRSNSITLPTDLSVVREFLIEAGLPS